ncbi:hypothetical protein KY308_01460 [Candidatus Woesearchaeota archaeon]|nr:hypothetical protein [Candidatus Woesearchaeota archaeon]
MKMTPAELDETTETEICSGFYTHSNSYGAGFRRVPYSLLMVDNGKKTLSLEFYPNYSGASIYEAPLPQSIINDIIRTLISDLQEKTVLDQLLHMKSNDLLRHKLCGVEKTDQILIQIKEYLERLNLEGLL